jgi:hypothetical protein
MHAAKRKYRVSNMEFRMMKLYGCGNNFIIRNSMFDTRYSFGRPARLFFSNCRTPENWLSTCGFCL